MTKIEHLKEKEIEAANAWKSSLPHWGSEYRAWLKAHTNWVNAVIDSNN